jgi:hypothetical protein
MITALVALPGTLGYAVLNGRLLSSIATVPGSQSSLVLETAVPCGNGIDRVPCRQGGASSHNVVPAESWRPAPGEAGSDILIAPPRATHESALPVDAVASHPLPALVSSHSGNVGTVHGGTGVNSATGSSGGGGGSSRPRSGSTDLPGLIAGPMVRDTATAADSPADTSLSTSVIAGPAQGAGAAYPTVFIEHSTTVGELTIGGGHLGRPITLGPKGEQPPMSSTPEPSSMLLIGTGVVGLAGFLRRRGLRKNA